MLHRSFEIYQPAELQAQLLNAYKVIGFDCAPIKYLLRKQCKARGMYLDLSKHRVRLYKLAGQSDNHDDPPKPKNSRKSVNSGISLTQTSDFAYLVSTSKRNILVLVSRMVTKSI